MDTELLKLLSPLTPVSAHSGQTFEQALETGAISLAYLARTYLGWDGPINLAELKTELARVSLQ